MFKNQLREYSTPSNPRQTLHPLSGFVDAKDCFSIIVVVLSPLKCKIRVSFEINLHDKDLAILYHIQSFFGVGKVYLRSKRNLCVYRVTVPSDLRKVIIPHFLEYPLISKKGDFIIWSKVVEMVNIKRPFD